MITRCVVTAILHATAAHAQGPWANITGEGIQVRSGHTTEANIVGTLGKGERVMVGKLLPGQLWARVS